jgi:O6-methylguanine-DNA--protein-cysteine methyltransferase
MSPFTPAGDRARWRIIYDLLTDADVGDTVTYEDMGAALGLDPDKDRHLIQMAVRRAGREYLTVNLRALAPIPNVGYRVVETSRQLEIAGQHQVKARRSIKRGREQVTYVDVSGLDEATRQMFETMAWKFSQQDEAIKRLDVRQQRMQKQVEAAVSAQEHTQEELAELRARLEKLEGERE